MHSRSLFTLAAGASLAVALTGCSALTRPDEITISKEPLGVQAQAPTPAAPAAAEGRAAAMPAGAAPRAAGTG